MSSGHTNRGRNNNNNNSRRSRHNSPRPQHAQGQPATQRRVESVMIVPQTHSGVKPATDNTASDAAAEVGAAYDVPVAQQGSSDSQDSLASVSDTAVDDVPPSSLDASETSEPSDSETIIASSLVIESAQFAGNVEAYPADLPDRSESSAPRAQDSLGSQPGVNNHASQLIPAPLTPSAEQSQAERGPLSGSSIRAPFSPGQNRTRQGVTGPRAYPNTPANPSSATNETPNNQQGSVHSQRQPSSAHPMRQEHPSADPRQPFPAAHSNQQAQSANSRNGHHSVHNLNSMNSLNGAQRDGGAMGRQDNESNGARSRASLEQPYRTERTDEHQAIRDHGVHQPHPSYQEPEDDEVFTFENRDVRGDIGPLVDSLHEIFERDRGVASQGGTARCGICYLHYRLSELQYREAEGYYVCADCAHALSQTRIMMVRRQQHI